VLKYFFLIPALILITSGRQALSQISVAPVSLYIHSPSNIASLHIANGYNTAREISVAFEFGYLSSDADGNQLMVCNDTNASSGYRLDSCLKAFPRKFLLAPGGSQTVRVQVRNMNGKPDGVYWSRIIISSGEVVEHTVESSGSQSVGTKINYVFRHNIPVFYRSGKVNTRLVPEKVSAVTENGKLKVLASLLREGNSPFNGSVYARLFDSENREVAFHRQTTAVYFNIVQKIEFDLPEQGLPAGDYMLELTYQTRRSDIAATDLVQADPVQYRIKVVID
jgi:hypothetical protein